MRGSQLFVSFPPAYRQVGIENLIHLLANVMSSSVEKGTFSDELLRLGIGYIVDFAQDEARLDELEHIRKNTLDADSDVWSQDDTGKLISLADRYNMILNKRF